MIVPSSLIAPEIVNRPVPATCPSVMSGPLRVSVECSVIFPCATCDTVAVAAGAATPVELIRVRVFEAKLLTQTDVPEAAMAGAVAPFAGSATRIGAPTFFAERTSIRETVPSS